MPGLSPSLGILFRRILSTTYTNLDHPLDEIYKSRSSGVGDRDAAWSGVVMGSGTYGSCTYIDDTLHQCYEALLSVHTLFCNAVRCFALFCVALRLHRQYGSPGNRVGYNHDGGMMRNDGADGC